MISGLRQLVKRVTGPSGRVCLRRFSDAKISPPLMALCGSLKSAGLGDGKGR